MQLPDIARPCLSMSHAAVLMRLHSSFSCSDTDALWHFQVSFGGEAGSTTPINLGYPSLYSTEDSEKTLSFACARNNMSSTYYTFSVTVLSVTPPGAWKFVAGPSARNHIPGSLMGDGTQLGAAVYFDDAAYSGSDLSGVSNKIR